MASWVLPSHSLPLCITPIQHSVPRVITVHCLYHRSLHYSPLIVKLQVSSSHSKACLLSQSLYSPHFSPTLCPCFPVSLHRFLVFLCVAPLGFVRLLLLRIDFVLGRPCPQPYLISEWRQEGITYQGVSTSSHFCHLITPFLRIPLFFSSEMDLEMEIWSDFNDCICTWMNLRALQ